MPIRAGLRTTTSRKEKYKNQLVLFYKKKIPTNNYYVLSQRIHIKLSDIDRKL